MSDNNKFSKNISSDSFWLRSAFMLMFIIIYSVSEILVYAVTLIQWLHVLFSGDTQPDLKKFAGSLAKYIAQIINYLSANSELKPFPFSNWPVVEDEQDL